MKSVILKFDDIKSKSDICPQWNAVFEYILSKNIKGSAGVIGKFLKGDDSKLFDWIKSISATGNIEFWNHGYSHCKFANGDREFFRTSYEYQCNSIKMTQSLAKDKLKITFTAFGAPHNLTDDNTEKALKTHPEIKVWLNTDPSVESTIPLLRVKKCEIAHISNDYYFTLDTFKLQFESLKNSPYAVMQFHPSGWTSDHGIRQFYQIIDYLMQQPDVKFTTPTEYVISNLKKD